ncbi:hypothetical protein E2C01_089113 [Portunus trituberculatus]|uniref:Uncharacterized protein n=1 Tax=Portunus trituberculatus TaxID=210409 RepID=A0A5B7JH95_PORTR|nr:hypothetical protein [Portunus trituberculatus]
MWPTQVQPEVYSVTRVPPGSSPRNREEFKPVLRCPLKECQLHDIPMSTVTTLNRKIYQYRN